MSTIFFLTLQKVGVLLLFMAAGYLLRRKGFVPADASHALSFLCTNVFLPAYTVLNLSRSFTADTIGENGLLALFGAVQLALCFPIAYLMRRLLGKTPMEKATMTYIFLFSNFGYFGYPVVEGVFGAEVMGKMMIFLLPFSIGINSFGYALFLQEGGGKRGGVFLRLLKAPLMWSVVLGIVLGLTGLPIPALVQDVLNGAGACMSPVSMILAGLVLGAYPLQKLFGGKKGYAIIALRMLAYPALTLAACLALGLKRYYFLFPALLSCLPLGMNTVVFPESRGQDASENARMVFQSTLFTLLSLPPAFALIFHLSGPM